MREGFSAIVKLWMVRYILPKQPNRWGMPNCRRAAWRLTDSTRSFTAAHRVVRSKTPQFWMLGPRLKACLTFLNGLLCLNHGSLGRNSASRDRDRTEHVPAWRIGSG
jgi:hypothetical protein